MYSKRIIATQREVSAFSVVLFVNSLWREENLSQVFQQPSAVEVSLGAVWRRITEVVCCCSRVAVLTAVTSALVPLIRSLVHENQVGMEEGVSRK